MNSTSGLLVLTVLIATTVTGCRTASKDPFEGASGIQAYASFPEAVSFLTGNFEGDPVILFDERQVKDIWVCIADPRLSGGKVTLAEFLEEVLAEHGLTLRLKSKASPVYEVIRARPKPADK